MMIALEGGVGGMMEDWMNVMREFSRGRDKRSERGEDEQNRRGRKSKMKQSAPTDATGARPAGVRLSSQALE